MPRRPAPLSDIRIDAKPAPPPGVTFVPAPSPRALVTIPATDPIWRGEAPAIPGGAIVRLKPPADASEHDVVRARELCERAGAARCRLDPREAGGEVLPRTTITTKPSERRTIRETVEETAREARTNDRPALLTFLDEVLTEEGL